MVSENSAPDPSFLLVWLLPLPIACIETLIRNTGLSQLVIVRRAGFSQEMSTVFSNVQFEKYSTTRLNLIVEPWKTTWRS